jgi:hypothetical protein
LNIKILDAFCLTQIERSYASRQLSNRIDEKHLAT